jgi:hypothetical protein
MCEAFWVVFAKGKTANEVAAELKAPPTRSTWRGGVSLGDFGKNRRG